MKILVFDDLRLCLTSCSMTLDFFSSLVTLLSSPSVRLLLCASTDIFIAYGFPLEMVISLKSNTLNLFSVF